MHKILRALVLIAALAAPVRAAPGRDDGGASGADGGAPGRDGGASSADGGAVRGTDGSAPPRADGHVATDAPSGSPSGLSPEEQRALEQALSADRAAESAKKRGAAATSPAVPAAPASGINAALTRVWQSLNPDISAIIDFAGGWYHGPILKSGDDPGDTGANLQEVELAFTATVDPYFRADVYLTIPNLSGIEVEEAFLTTTSLPASLQLRAGMMRAPFGRQNTQHLHLQDFTRRPQMNAIFLGDDGLRAPGAELSWLAPLPFYVLITGAAYSVAPPENEGLVRTFGGGSRTDFTYLGNVRTFAALTDTVSLLLDLSFATGQSARFLAEGGGSVETLGRSYLYGGSAYLKWKPPNVSRSWLSLAWTTEYYLRHIPDQSQLDGGLYSQVLLQVARRWFLGFRGEIDGLPSSTEVPRQYAGATSLTWALSEFARARLYGEARYAPDVDSGQRASYAAFLQLEASIGAHGAHPY